MSVVLYEKNSYLHQCPDDVIDCCYTSNFDERYLSIFPVLKKQKLVNLVAKYPDFNYSDLMYRIKSLFNLDNLILGSGGEDLIIQVNNYLNSKHLRMGVVVPIFHRIVETCHLPIDYISVDDINKFCWDKIDALWIQNPNMFNGVVHNKKYLQKIIKQHPKVLFLVDEVGIFTIKEWRKYSLLGDFSPPDNLLLISSFSKMHGLSGLRIGFLTGSKKLLNVLSNHNTTFPVSSLAAFYLENILNKRNLDFFLDKIHKSIEKNKNELLFMFNKIKDIEIKNSLVNCLFLNSKNGKNIFSCLFAAGILTLDLSEKKDGTKVRMTIHSSSRLHGLLKKKVVSFKKIWEIN